MNDINNCPRPLLDNMARVQQRKRKYFRLWKWNAMDNRRPFYFIFLNLILTFSWLLLHLGISNNRFFPDYDQHDDDNESKKFSPLGIVPLIIFLIHGLCVLLLFFNGFNQLLIVNQSRTKRFCEWSCYSSITVCYCFVFLILDKKDEDSEPYLSVSVVFPIVSSCSMLIVHHLGLTQPLLILIKFMFIIVWIFFLTKSNISPAAIVCLALSILTFFSFGSLTEHEYFRAYIQKSRDGQIFQMENGSIWFSAEATDALRCVTSIISSQIELLKKNSVNNSKSEVLYFEKLISYSEEVKYFSGALLGGLVRQEDIRNSKNYSEFVLTDVCKRIFSILEGVKGHRLPLFISENIPNLIITSKQSIFEIVIFLLLYCHLKDELFCTITCDNSNGEGWILSLQIQKILDKNENNALNPNQTSNSNSANNNILSPSSNKLHRAKSISFNEDSTVLPINNHSSVHTDLPVINSLDKIINIGKYLYMNNDVKMNIDVHEHLAEKLTIRHLLSSIYQDKAYTERGICIIRTIPLETEQCDVMRLDSNSIPSHLENKEIDLPDHKFVIVLPPVNENSYLTEIKSNLNKLNVPLISETLVSLKMTSKAIYTFIIHSNYFSKIDDIKKLLQFRQPVSIIIIDEENKKMDQSNNNNQNGSNSSVGNSSNASSDKESENEKFLKNNKIKFFRYTNDYFKDNTFEIVCNVCKTLPPRSSKLNSPNFKPQPNNNFTNDEEVQIISHDKEPSFLYNKQRESIENNNDNLLFSNKNELNLLDLPLLTSSNFKSFCTQFHDYFNKTYFCVIQEFDVNQIQDAFINLFTTFFTAANNSKNTYNINNFISLDLSISSINANPNNSINSINNNNNNINNNNNSFNNKAKKIFISKFFSSGIIDLKRLLSENKTYLFNYYSSVLFLRASQWGLKSIAAYFYCLYKFSTSLLSVDSTKSIIKLENNLEIESLCDDQNSIHSTNSNDEIIPPPSNIVIKKEDSFYKTELSLEGTVFFKFKSDKSFFTQKSSNSINFNTISTKDSTNRNLLLETLNYNFQFISIPSCYLYDSNAFSPHSSLIKALLTSDSLNISYFRLFESLFKFYYNIEPPIRDKINKFRNMRVHNTGTASPPIINSEFEFNNINEIEIHMHDNMLDLFSNIIIEIENNLFGHSI